MPTVKGKKYPYTKAGKAAAKKAKGRLKAASDAGLKKARTAETKKAALKRALDNMGLKRAGKAVKAVKKANKGKAAKAAKAGREKARRPAYAETAAGMRAYKARQKKGKS